MTTLHLRKSIDRSKLRLGFLLVALVLGCFAFSPMVKAVTPAPDGGYPNQTTAEGDNALRNLTSGVNNTAVGFNALFKNTTGFSNTAIGDGALTNNTVGGNNDATGINALFANISGGGNTADGSAALLRNTTGSNNTAIGWQALLSNTIANDNTAIGVNALAKNTKGVENTATGSSALQNNTTGSSNTAMGFSALFSNTTGERNTADGYIALSSNRVGTRDTAIGFQALTSNTSGTSNTAIGDDALFSNTTGNSNTASGKNALLSNTTGKQNTAYGLGALSNNETGINNIALGFTAGFNITGSNNIDIGSLGVANESNAIRIGNAVATAYPDGSTHPAQTATFIAGIYGIAVTGSTVVVNSSGQLGVAPSSERFKEAIKPMNKASEAILSLQPLTFRYKHELDPDGILQFGLVAEQVEKVNPDLVVRGDDGKVMTVRYEAVNAMLLNEFLKEHRKVQEVEKDLRSTIAQQQKQLEVLTATLQKVSDQVALSKPAPQLVANP